MLQTQLDFDLALEYAVDPVIWARSLAWTAEPWQARMLRSTAPQMVLQCGRQTGRSEPTGILGCHTAIFEDDTLVLLAARNQTQSTLFMSKVKKLLSKVEPFEELAEDNKTSITLRRNQSRVVALPGH